MTGMKKTKVVLSRPKKPRSSSKKAPSRTGQEEKERARRCRKLRPSFQVQRRRGEKRPRAELGRRVPDEIRPCRNCVERLRLNWDWTLGRRSTRPRPRAHLCRRLRLPVREGMQRLLHHAEVRRLWERRCRKRVYAAGAVVGTAAAGKLVP